MSGHIETAGQRAVVDAAEPENTEDKPPPPLLDVPNDRLKTATLTGLSSEINKPVHTVRGEC